MSVIPTEKHKNYRCVWTFNVRYIHFILLLVARQNESLKDFRTLGENCMRRKINFPHYFIFLPNVNFA